MSYHDKQALRALKAVGANLRTKDAGDAFDVVQRSLRDLTEHTEKRIGETEGKFAEVSEQLSCIEQKMARGASAAEMHRADSWGEEFTKACGEQIHSLSEANRGSVQLNVKNTLTTGATSAGALDVPYRDATVSNMPRRRMMVRNLMNVIQIASGSIEYAAQTDRTINAATVQEGATKPESDLAWELRNTTPKVIAHWIKASRQILEDQPQLRDTIDTELRYGLALVEEAQLLYGDGTGSNLDGMIPNATAFADPLNLPSPDMIDMIGSAILQTALTEFMPDGIVVHMADWMRMRLLKDGDGRYILGDPQAVIEPRLFGLPVVPTQAMEVDTFLVGSFASCGTLYDRWQPRVEVAYENDDFTRNLVTVLAEERVALAVKQPLALTVGDFGNVA